MKLLTEEAVCKVIEGDWQRARVLSDSQDNYWNVIWHMLSGVVKAAYATETGSKEVLEFIYLLQSIVEDHMMIWRK